MKPAAGDTMRRSSTNISASGLLDIFKMSTKTILALLCGTAAKWSKSAPDSEVRVAFLKSSSWLEGYITTIRDNDLEEGNIREAVERERKMQRKIATSRFGSFSDKKNIFVLVSGGREECSGLWVANVLLLLRNWIWGSNESEAYESYSVWMWCVRYMQWTRHLRVFFWWEVLRMKWTAAWDEALTTRSRVATVLENGLGWTFWQFYTAVWTLWEQIK